jgi:hypothetical protein
MEFTRTYVSRTEAGIRIHVKRVSLNERLRFTQQSFECIQKLQFLASQAEQDDQTLASIHQLEVDLSKLILRYVWLGIEDADGMRQVNDDLIEWLLSDAPADFCCEVVALCSEQMSLSSAQRKK